MLLDFLRFQQPLVAKNYGCDVLNFLKTYVQSYLDQKITKKKIKNLVKHIHGIK